MEKQTKNVITREWVQKELLFYIGADLKYSLVLLAVMSVTFLPISAFAVRGAFMGEGVWALKAFLAILGGTISLPFWIMLVSFCSALIERKKVMRGEFSIVTGELKYKAERAVYRHVEECLYFDDSMRISVNHTEYQLATPGDLYYLVCCDFKGVSHESRHEALRLRSTLIMNRFHGGKKRNVRLFYACRRYDLKE